VALHIAHACAATILMNFFTFFQNLQVVLKNWGLPGHLQRTRAQREYDFSLLQQQKINLHKTVFVA
jgi:hypothetical protein